jgi:hypothetical protein
MLSVRLSDLSGRTLPFYSDTILITPPRTVVEKNRRGYKNSRNYYIPAYFARKVEHPMLGGPQSV